MSLYVRLTKHPLTAVVSNPIDSYPTPINLNFMWSFGFLASPALVIQNITGVLLAMHYAPEIHLAFTSVKHIMRDVRRGVALRYIHANGASMFFKSVYILPIVPKPTVTYFESIGYWVVAHPIATTCIVVGSIGLGIVVWYAIAGTAGAAGGATGAALASEVVSNLPASSPVGSASQIAGTSLELLVPAVAQVVLAEPEITKIVFKLIAGGTGIMLVWATSADLPIFTELSEEQLKSLQELAEQLVRENPYLFDEIFKSYTPEEFETGLRLLGERSGILSQHTPVNSARVARITANLLSEETTSFSDVVSAVEGLPIKSKFKVLLLFHFTTIIIGLLSGPEA